MRRVKKTQPPPTAARTTSSMGAVAREGVEKASRAARFNRLPEDDAPPSPRPEASPKPYRRCLMCEARLKKHEQRYCERCEMQGAWIVRPPYGQGESGPGGRHSKSR